MRVLVTGGTGNISRRIVSDLLNRNHDVTIFNRGHHVDKPPTDVRCIRGDRFDPVGFEGKMQGERFDAVIDMICYNADHAESALRAFRGRVDVFVHCSSVMTYGPPFTGINADETAPLNGSTGYGTGKIGADCVFLDAYESDGFPVIIIKPSYTHGPGMTLLRQVRCNGSWIDRLQKGKPILSVGDGQNYFQFLSSRDAGIAFAVAVTRSKCIGQVYNLVHPEPMTWDEWHHTAAEALGVDTEIVHVTQDMFSDLAPGLARRLSQNFGYTQIFSGSKLAMDIPEFRPSVPTVESVAENIAWMDDHNLVPDSDGDNLEDRIIDVIGGLSLTPIIGDMKNHFDENDR